MPANPTKTTSWTLRMPTPQYQALRDQYAETYAQHRKSFNQWCLDNLMQAVGLEK